LVHEFICYKQKCKVAPFNLAHPVVYIVVVTQSVSIICVWYATH